MSKGVIEVKEDGQTVLVDVSQQGEDLVPQGTTESRDASDFDGRLGLRETSDLEEALSLIRAGFECLLNDVRQDDVLKAFGLADVEPVDSDQAEGLGSYSGQSMRHFRIDDGKWMVIGYPWDFGQPTARILSDAAHQLRFGSRRGAASGILSR